MEEVFVGDFWIQLSAAVLASVITLCLQPSWWSSFRRSKSLSEEPVPANHMSISDSTVHGDVNIQQQVRNQTQHVNIRKNIYNSSSRQQDGDDVLGFIGIIIVVSITACIAFVLTGFLLQWVSYGILLGTLVLLVFAVITTSNQASWDINAIAVSCVTLLSTWTTLSTWICIRKLERDGMSLESVAQSVQNAVAEARNNDVNFMYGAMEYVVPTFFGVHEHVLIFISLILLGVVAQIVQLVFAVLAMLDWHASLFCQENLQVSERASVRAQRHAEMKPWGLIVAGIIFSVTAYILSQGIAFDIWTGLSVN